MSKHTPGPWIRVAHSNGRLGETICFMGTDELTATDICRVMPEDEHSEALRIADANAKLIAASPKMLEALQETQVDVCDARLLADKLLNNRGHSVTGTEAERIAYLLQTMSRNARVAAAAIAKATQS